jgi:dipeptidyl aminopeptidase/acylaminoacyl peptidase
VHGRIFAGRRCTRCSEFPHRAIHAGAARIWHAPRCIYGASYGAYAAMMGAIRQAALYRCAAGYAGVHDLNKLYRWDSLRKSDLGREFLHRAVGTDRADLAANSPAQHAGRIRASVFLAHARLDGIADLRFARPLEKAINRTRDQRVELIEYPNQGRHGLRVPAQREDFYARLLAFLHDNLDAPGAPVEAAGAAP